MHIRIGSEACINSWPPWVNELSWRMFRIPSRPIWSRAMYVKTAFETSRREQCQPALFLAWSSRIFLEVVALRVYIQVARTQNYGKTKFDFHVYKCRHHIHTFTATLRVTYDYMGEIFDPLYLKNHLISHMWLYLFQIKGHTYILYIAQV